MNSAPLGTPRAGGGGASPRQLKPSSASLKALVSNGEKMARRHNAWLYMSQLDQDQHGGLDTTLVPLGVGERHDDYRRLQEETRLRHEQQELANLRAEQVEDRTARLACEVAAHEAERKRSAELAQQLIASRAAQEALVAEGRQVSEEMGRLRRCLEEEKAARAAETSRWDGRLQAAAVDLQQAVSVTAELQIGLAQFQTAAAAREEAWEVSAARAAAAARDQHQQLQDTAAASVAEEKKKSVESAGILRAEVAVAAQKLHAQEGAYLQRLRAAEVKSAAQHVQ